MGYWNKRSAECKCPYYEKENKTCIVCEGVAPQSRTILRFDEEGGKFKWQEANCLAYPNGCPIANGNDDKY